MTLQVCGLDAMNIPYDPLHMTSWYREMIQEAKVNRMKSDLVLHLVEDDALSYK